MSYVVTLQTYHMPVQPRCMDTMSIQSLGQDYLQNLLDTSRIGHMHIKPKHMSSGRGSQVLHDLAD